MTANHVGCKKSFYDSIKKKKLTFSNELKQEKYFAF